MPPPQAEGEAPVRRVAVVMNARAGAQQVDRRREELAAAFDSLEVAAEFVDIADADALRAVSNPPGKAYDVVVAAGGDGTVNTVANALAAAAPQAAGGAPPPMGIIALGTFNYVARRYGLSAQVDEAARTVVGGRTIGIPAGKVAGRLFLNNCSLGLYTSIIDARERHKAVFGRSRAVALVSSIATMLGGHARLLVGVAQEGRHRTLRASLVFVGANPLQLADIDPAIAQQVEDGALALVIVRAIDLRRLVGFTWRALTGAVIDAPEIEAEAVQSVTLALRKRRARVVVDGELADLPGTLEVRWQRDALRLRVPGATQAQAPAATTDPDLSGLPA